MTVFVAHAPADLSAAEALERVIERRGQFVELDDGVTALRPVMGGDVLVLLVSQALSSTTARLRLEQRALDAWAEGRLILVKLDQGAAPVGLRDLPAFDASVEAQRDSKWTEIADAVREKLTSQGPARPDEAPAAKRGASPLVVALGLILAAGVAVPLLSFYPQSATGGDISFFGIEYTWLQLGVAVGGAMALTILLALIFSAVSRGPRGKAKAPSQTESVVAGSAVFVSYARANEGVVLPVIEAAKKAGRKFWLDQKGGIAAGDGWAGEIVRAIRGSAGVVVMCSQAAFESDHVKREIYLADRYRKKLAPVFIEAAEPPEDFEYFFAGVQPLKLFETPEAERPQALIRVLGAST